MATDIRELSTTAASNTSRFPENMPLAAVNDMMRDLEAEIARLLLDEGAAVTLGGGPGAYTATLNTSPTSLRYGLFFSAKCAAANTGPATLIVTPRTGGAFASKKIKKISGIGESDLAAGDLLPSGHYLFQYDNAMDGGAGAYILLNPSSKDVFTKSYESAEQAITSAGLITMAHGFGAEPKDTRVLMICKTAEAGWSVGDKLLVHLNSSTGNIGANRFNSLYFDSANIYLRYSDNAQPLIIAVKSTGVVQAVTNANWRVIVRAWA